MSETLRLPDAAARQRIATDLETNFVVEAGAGSGKTTELLHRMLRLLASGVARTPEIAAVTFTRKAAGELRERFQNALEQAVEEAAPESNERDRLLEALRTFERAFVGTIHAFCARLLRERPLDAGLDPAFRELQEDEAERLAVRFWRSHLARLAAAGSRELDELEGLGLEVGELFELFKEISDNPDVRYQAPESELPGSDRIQAVRQELEPILELALAPASQGQLGEKPDDLQKKLPRLRFLRYVKKWDALPVFFEALAYLLQRKDSGIVLKRWPDRRIASSLKTDLNRFLEAGSRARGLLADWRAHRYAVVVRIASEAAEDFAVHRKRTGQVTFQDLLVHAARLLKTRPDARRELGGRYRRILVDEFQDTDPLQAEVLFLLASPPENDAADAPGDWRRASPRPGSLFVVGDPKQSIYRFRRADIAVYEEVKRRIGAFGSVVRLTANFRSREEIAQLVNETFSGEGGFPPRESSYQAAFAPLEPQPARGPVPAQGIFWYDVPGSNARDLVARDAAGLASWVRRRSAPDGDRAPRDFLILTPYKWHLEYYARELEARGVPVHVSGSGVGVEKELGELILLLECLADPGDPVSTTAVLVGPFFGIDHETLARHRVEDGGTFRFTAPDDEPPGRVRDALKRLNLWWWQTRREPADVFVPRIVGEIGLLPYAACDELGEVKAGALAYALEVIRQACLEGRTSLTDAVEALEAALASPEAEAPLRPGRDDVVRLMNLHKAKGLEAPVVVLAAPLGGSSRPIWSHVARGSGGEALGWAVLLESRGRYQKDIHAQPPGWEGWEKVERSFQDAEEVRKLYVATTRAGHELIVARRAEGKSDSPWRPLDPWLLSKGAKLELPVVPAPPGAEPARTVTEIRDRITGIADERRARGAPSYSIQSVTSLAKARGQEESGQLNLSFGEEEMETSEAPSRGMSWGSAVHGALAAAGRGARGSRLRKICHALLVENHRPLSARGIPDELDDLLRVVEAVVGSSLWQRAMAADQVLVEAPFAVRLGEATGSDEILEGVVDLAFHEGDGWVVADYKTDVGTDPRFPMRRKAYRRQVDLYGRCWKAVTGQRVKERVILFTALGRSESW